MNNRNNHIIQTSRMMRSFLKISIVLACIFMFISTNKLFAQVINNNGAAISVSNGTFVQGDTLENTSGTITNEGTIGLKGHYINKAFGTTKGDGIYNIQGNWFNAGTFIPGISTVRFNGNNFQIVTSGGDNFFHLVIDNSGVGLTNRVILSEDVSVSDTLDFTSGNIETGANKLYLVNQTIASLKYNSMSGSRVIGRFERGVNTLGEYLFPIGSDDNYNPLNLTPNNLTAGSVLSEFIANDPLDAGLPLPDEGYVNPTDTVEVYRSDSIGYWSLTAYNSFTSSDYNINLNGAGFLTPYQNATRIIKRTGIPGDWTLDGTHKDGLGSVAFRNELSEVIAGGLGNHFAWGCIRPRIQTQPADTAVCDGESATFSIVATGRGTLTYEWEVLEVSGGWIPVTDDAIYANYDTDTLLIIAADTSMNGYKYRAIVRDSLENFHRSNAQATLTVYPRPVVTATPQQDTICNGATTHIVLTSTELGTAYILEILNPSNNIDGDLMTLDGDTIKDQLTNSTLFADSVVYRIVPWGPFNPSCNGTADTVIIWVEPTVIITAVDDTICDNTPTAIAVTSDNITTNGMRYTWTVTPNVNITGEADSDAIGQVMGTSIIQTLNNISPIAQLVTYTITPWTIDANGNNKCAGTLINVDIWIEPTVVIVASNDTICDNTSTAIAVTSTNITTNGMRFTWTVTPNANINGETDSDVIGQIMGTSIIQTLDNLSDSKQLVRYVITPWTVNASSNNECTDAAEVITIDIWIDPTPQVYVSVLADTICNDTRTHITLTTPTILTSGVVTFDYTSIADALLTGSSNQNDLTDSYIIEDLLNNASVPASPLVVRYNITPRALSIACADGPTITDSITVHPTPDTYMFADSVVCYLESNGIATVDAENGINEFTYEWDDLFNQTDSFADGLPIGLYTVTVTDNQSCIKIDSVLIEQPNRLVPVIDTIRDVSCFGIGDAFIILTPTGGNQGYTYLWSNGETTDSIGGLNGGKFYATVTDWKGCIQDTIVGVDEPPQASIDIFERHITCNGENDGRAQVSVIGLDIYKWSTDETTEVISNLSPGLYSVTASNIEGCKAIASITIKEPKVLEIDTIYSERISCAGDADGILNLIAKEGNVVNFYTGDSINNPYTYNWYTLDGSGLVQDTAHQSVLSGGTYYVTVTDKEQGCFAIDSAYILEPPTYLSNINVSDILCNGENNGTADLYVEGGNTEEAYTYLWTTNNGSGLDPNSQDQTNLSEGEYYVKITDAKDCELIDTAIINQPDLLETFLTKTDVTCFGYDDGSAIIDITGGIGTYSISWSNGSSNDTISGLSANTYNVNVSDGNDCVTSDFVEIIEPKQIEINTNSQNITCFGLNNGEIIITPEGGVLPYNYLWSHSPTFSDSIANNLVPGNYSISVVDNNNCIETSSSVLTQPDQLELDVTKEDITCFGLNDGYISLSMFGGTPDYTYSWSDGNNESSANMLTDGYYNIIISDINNCEIDTSIEIIEPFELQITPNLDYPTCSDISDGFVELNITGGRTPYNIYWNNGSNEANLYDIRSGIYKVLISDSSYCEVDSTFTLRSAFEFCINIPSVFSPNGDNINEKWVIDMNSLYPDAEVEIYDRTGKRIFYSRGYEESQYWDGTFNGKDLQMDAYYYLINLKNGSGRISGTITLLR